MKSSVFTSIRQKFSQRLGIVPGATWTQDEILQIFDMVCAETALDALDAQSHHQQELTAQIDMFYASIVNLFWQQTFCSGTDADNRKTLQAYHYMTMRDVYQHFLEWCQGKKFASNDVPSEKRFCGQHGLFLQAGGNVFEYCRTNTGRRIMCKDVG